MPKDCKLNSKQEPVYNPESFAYRNRRNIECYPEHILMLWHCADVSKLLPNIGLSIYI